MVDFDAMWEVLKSSLTEIHSKRASQLSFEELYRNAYKLVLKKRGETLYERVKDFEQEWLTDEVRPGIETTLTASLLALTMGSGGQTISTANEKRSDGDKLLRALKSAWEDHNLCMNMTTDVLMYMVGFPLLSFSIMAIRESLTDHQDRVYCKDFRKPSIFTASMGQFRDYVLRAPLLNNSQLTIFKVLNAVILDQIRMDRDGDMIDKQLLKSCVYMMEGLYLNDEEEESTRLYLTSFEPEFLSASREFYQKEGTSLLQEADAGTFCKHAKRRVSEEQDRCRSTLSILTQPKIREVVEDELVRKHLRDVIALPNSGVKYMLDNDRLTELEMMYDLSARVDPKKEELRDAIQAQIVHLGTEINRAAMSSPKESTADNEKADASEKVPHDKPLNQQTVFAIKWVDDVLMLKGKYEYILDASFHGDRGLETAFSRSFTIFINTFERSSEYLSLFFDENMKKGIKGKTENEVDTLLDNGITLLRYIQDKDLFERYYKKHLSRRLLMKRSVSMDAERQMISKMKLEVGATFTNRIEAMFKDINISGDLTSNYKSHVQSLGDHDPRRTDLEISVLTSTMWPLESMTPEYGQGRARPTCVFPTHIEHIKTSFEKFYLGKHSGRKLTWQANMGTADIRAHFPHMKGPKKTRELNVSTYAMVILLLFNELPDGQSITCEEIQADTNIPFNELTRNLQSLAVAPKTRILVKEPMSKDVKMTDKFSFNDNFYSQFQKVKIGVVSSVNRVEDTAERTETEQKIDESRKGIIEAAVVRIMKFVLLKTSPSLTLPPPPPPPPLHPVFRLLKSS